LALEEGEPKGGLEGTDSKLRGGKKKEGMGFLEGGGEEQTGGGRGGGRMKGKDVSFCKWK